MTAAEWLDQAQAVWDAPLTDQERTAIAAAAMPRALAALRAAEEACIRAESADGDWRVRTVTHIVRRAIEEAL